MSVTKLKQQTLMKLQANISTFHTVFMLFLATLAVRAMEPSTPANGGVPLLKCEQAPNAQAGSLCLAGQPHFFVGAWMRATRVETMKAHFQEAARRCLEGATALDHNRAADMQITSRGRINEAGLDFVVCALILWGLLSAFPS